MNTLQSYFFVFFVISKHVHSQDLKWNKIDQ